jgi:hypothetical protein
MTATETAPDAIESLDFRPECELRMRERGKCQRPADWIAILTVRPWHWTVCTRHRRFIDCGGAVVNQSGRRFVARDHVQTWTPLGGSS